MRPSQDEVRDRIAKNKRRLKIAESNLEEGMVVQDQIPSTFYEMALYTRGIGICYAELNEKDKALKWFRRAANLYFKMHEKTKEYQQIIERSHQENKPLVLVDALHMALLSLNKELTIKFAKYILELDNGYLDEFPESAEWYFYTKCTAAVALDHTSQIEEYRVKLAKKSDKSLKREKHLPMYTEAISDRNTDKVEKSIQNLLEDHEQSITTEKLADDELVSIEATVWYLLAKQKGLKVDIQSEYIPDIYTD